MSSRCGCSLLYTENYTLDSIQQWMDQEDQRCRTLIPFQRSGWKQMVSHTMYQSGGLLRATMLSGGKVTIPFQNIGPLYRRKAVDLEQAVTFTDVEWAHNSEGIRLFFELDYCHDRLPTPQDVVDHLHCIRTLVEEAYPKHDDYTMHIATTHPSTKKGSDDIPKYKWGIHVVFPTIILTTMELRRLALALDTRIARQSACWNSIVDPNSYKSECATLRPPFSHKAIRCVVCTASSHGLPSEFCDCVRGYRVKPGVYTYCGTIPHQNPVPTSSCCTLQLTFELGSILEVLTGMSIIPPRIGMHTSGFVNIPDMGEGTDRILMDGALSTVEKRVLQRTKRRKQCDIPAKYQQACFTILQCIVTRIHERYRNLVIETVKHCTARGELFITVKGPGMRWCTSKGTTHRNNRIYFILSMKHLTIRTGCFNVKCRARVRQMNVRTQSTQLTKHEVIQLSQLPIGIVCIMPRKISTKGPALQASQACLKLTKREVYEKRLQKYLKSREIPK